MSLRVVRGAVVALFVAGLSVGMLPLGGSQVVYAERPGGGGGSGGSGGSGGTLTRPERPEGSGGSQGSGSQTGGLQGDGRDGEAQQPSDGKDPKDVALRLEDLPKGYSQGQSQSYAEGATQAYYGVFTASAAAMLKNPVQVYNGVISGPESNAEVIQASYQAMIDKLTAGLEQVSSPGIGNESVAFGGTQEVNGVQMTVYAVVFRVDTIVGGVAIYGTRETADLDTAVEYAEVMADRA